jgi:hypothetical protein
MMSTFNLPIARFVQTLEIVDKEGRHYFVALRN